jgi:glycerol-3-phosphate O-acyltransferase
VLGPGLARRTGREILDEAVHTFHGYYTTPVLEPRGDEIVLSGPRLLFYYQNRLSAHGLAYDRGAPRTGGPPEIDAMAALRRSTSRENRSALR